MYLVRATGGVGNWMCDDNLINKINKPFFFNNHRQFYDTYIIQSL